MRVPGSDLHFVQVLIRDELSERVIGAILEVSNTLGAGFLEKVYERALLFELKARGMRAQAQVPVPVRYKGALVGTYLADVLVEEELILELKCVESLGPDHMAQCLNYLKATGKDSCLLVNFQRSRAEWKRVLRPLQASDLLATNENE